MKWKKFTLKTLSEVEDIVISTLAEAGVEGVEIEDKVPLTESKDDGIAYLNFYVEEDTDETELLERVKAELDDLRNFMDIGECTNTASETEDKDWINNWKQYFHQFYVDDILIIPSWEDVKPSDEDKMVIHIDPGTAFGTGMHETTQLCIRQLEKYVHSESEILDVGTGSGILGITALKLGAKEVWGTDLDENAITAVGENLEANGIAPEQFKVVQGNIIDDKTVDVSQGIIHHKEGVDLIPSNIELSGLEVRLINALSRESVLKTYVNEVKRDYDFVLIDCMPSLGMITINSLAAADSVVIPTQPHYLSAKGLELLLRTVSKVKRQINPRLRIDGILMTMVMPRTNISKDIISSVKSAYGQKIKVFDTQIPHSVRAVEATAEGKSIFAYDKGGKVAAAYEQFAKEVVEIGEKQRKQNRADRLR